MTVTLLILAGGLGAVARFLADGAVRARLGDAFPWGTMLVNVTGSLLLGVLTGLVLHQGTPDAWRAVLGTGFCGGYTTFSAASVETVRLAQRGVATRAFGYAVGTVVLCAAAAALGLAITR